MKIPSFIFLFVVLLSTISSTFAQDSEVDWENWIGEIEGGKPSILLHRYDSYTQTDVIKAKQKLLLLKQILPKNEWEGTYVLNGELSDTKLIWNSQVGFLKYHIYTCQPELRSLDFGKAKASNNQIELFSENPSSPELKNTFSQKKFITVKWGDVHYLVPEDELKTFCELAAGYYGSGKSDEVEIEGETYSAVTTIWNSFWKKQEDFDKKHFGLPILPKRYKHLIKTPIEAEILSVDEQKLELAEEDFLSSSSYRYLTINAGKNKNISADIVFYSPDLQERIFISEVGEKTSKGYIQRDFDREENKEDCYKKGQEIPCVIPAVRMKIKTVPDEFLETD